MPIVYVVELEVVELRYSLVKIDSALDTNLLNKGLSYV
jgi:hypothetical protein